VLEGVDRTAIENFEELTGQRLAADQDGDVRFDFTEDDLRAIREQAIDQLVHRAEENGLDLTRDEIERLLREDPRELEFAGLDDLGLAFEIGVAQTPEEILVELYRMGGGFGDASVAMQNLLDFTMDTARARHGLREFPKDHPDSRLPGSSNVPDCG
jgi:hypothetical protein